jgi:hypothetical protein
MRFSLAMLILVVLWIGAAGAVWFEREPWRQVPMYFVLADSYQPMPRLDKANQREVFNSIQPSTIEFATDNPFRVLTSIHYTTNGASSWIDVGFVDSDTILGVESHVLGCTEFKYSPLLFHRRFPEWWWGHFYRPEVWLFIGLSGALLWRFARWRRKSAA